MASWYRVVLLVMLTCLLHEAMADCNSEGESCDQRYQTLASFLVNTSDNLYQLQRAFFPPNRAPPVFVTVTYSYTSNLSNVSNHSDIGNTSSHTWYWSIGAFYLFQPPKVFQFTSLLFGIPYFRTGNVTVVLPEDCKNAPQPHMESLTQMLKLYAMKQRANPPIDNTYIGVVADESNLCNIYCDPIFHTNIPVLLWCFQFLFPPLAIVLVILYICSSKESIQKYVEKQIRHPTNWATISAYAVICFILVLCVTALDTIAFYNQTNDTSEYNLLFWLPLPLAVWDVLAIIFGGIMIISCRIYKLEKRYMYISLMLFGIAPLLCLASHTHYIAIAWLTDPAYASAIGIYYGISIFLWFFMLKQAYASKLCRRVLQLLFASILVLFFQTLVTAFFILIPIKHSIENTPTDVYAVINGISVLLLTLIAYKVTLDPRGLLSISRTIQNVLDKMKRNNLMVRGVTEWNTLNEEEKFTELVYHYYGIANECVPQSNERTNVGGTSKKQTPSESRKQTQKLDEKTKLLPLPHT